jgi:undecaprenyl-diphosphatase
MINTIDLTVNSFMAGIQNPALTKFFLFITNLGNVWIIIPLSLVLIFFLLYNGHKREAFLAALAISSTAIICEILKILVGSPRPSNALVSEIITQSFPSWHAAMSTAFFLTLLFIYKDKIRNKTKRNVFISSCIMLIILVSLSRLYLNVHWLTDIIAGLLLGITSVLFVKAKMIGKRL